MRKIVISTAAAVALLGLGACSQNAQNETAEAADAVAADAAKAGDTVAAGAEKAADATVDAAKDAGAAMKEGAKEVGKATDEMGAKIEDKRAGAEAAIQSETKAEAKAD